jgi:2-phosphosulfolactate phosphatase
VPHLHVALGPHDAAPCDVAIVVDCIRATTTLAHALAAGYERVVCVGEIAHAHALREELGDGTVLGGERHGVRIPGFDLGNSPAEYGSAQGATLVLSTTNGTRAILQSAVESERVLVGALVCLDAVVEAAAAADPGDVAVRCAGVRGEVALDDVYVAGRIVEALAARLPGHVPTDAARVALATRRAYPTARAALEASQSARDLDGTGHEDDVARCARESVLGVAPRVATVAPGRAELV